MARKTKVTKAPFHPDGSLLHYPGDFHEFDHYESDAGERLERSDIWERIDTVERDGPLGPIERKIRSDWKIVYRDAEWRDNEPFHASLQIRYLHSGRSAKFITLKPVNDPLDTRTYPMFVADLIDVAQRLGIEPGGIMSGRWMVAQRGQNYGLRLAKEGE